MTDARITEARAIGVAAQAARIPGPPVAVHFVERLDGANPYFLVYFGEPSGPGAAVTVDAMDGTVMAQAAVESVKRPWLIGRERAVEIAGCSQPEKAQLVWMPCRATRSPFYPLWEVTRTSGKVWVDQSGRVWPEITQAGPG